jgi:hypothetical protein
VKTCVKPRAVQNSARGSEVYRVFLTLQVESGTYHRRKRTISPDLVVVLVLLGAVFSGYLL